MKRLSTLLFATVFAAGAIMPTAAYARQDGKQLKPVVMIVGAYHMGNPGRDLGNVDADDVRAEKRQKEMAEFVAVLKKFRPTKIAVEMPPSRVAYLDGYPAYREGKYELRANEVDQIGFRLAKDLNHPKVYTIDWPGNFDFDKVAASAKANGQAATADAFMASAKREAGKMTELLKSKTVGEMFRYLNDDKLMDEWHSQYMSVLRVGGKEDFAGADLVSDWYQRNLRIYSNMARLVESNDERILVIIGAGHTKLLRQFVSEAGEFEQQKLERYF